MYKKPLSCLLIILFKFLFPQQASSQDFARTESPQQEISIESFMKDNVTEEVSIKKDYPEFSFIETCKSLDSLYFIEMNSIVSRRDSSLISTDFHNLPRSLQKHYVMETRKLIRKLIKRSLKVVTDKSASTGWIIEPRFVLELERNRPMGYVVKLEYVLIGRISNKTYLLRL